MDSISNADKMFSFVLQQQANRSSIASYAVANGASLLQKKDYTGAVAQFKKAIGLDPNSLDAYSKLGSTYLMQNKTKEATDAFKQVIRINPTSADAYKDLGNAYLQAKNLSNAEKQYKISASLDKSSTYPPYTLGHIYVQTNRLSEADQQFRKVVALAPKDAHGYYGLGLVHNKLGKYDDAVRELSKAVSLKKDLASAQYELGVAYNSLGQKDKAKEQIDILQGLDDTLASDLANTLFEPRMIAALPSTKTFNILKGPGTLLSSLDPSLLTPSKSKNFNMVFQFNTEMDMPSVTNPANWTISKAISGSAGTYNNGVNLNSEREAVIPRTPRIITYDPSKMQATLYFTLSQNAAGNATIDPSHLVFKFSGESLTGKRIDETADEIDGYAGLPF